MSEHDMNADDIAPDWVRASSPEVQTPQDHYIVMSRVHPGYWGKAKTLQEAVKNAEWLREGDDVVVVPCESDSHVDDFGTLYRRSRVPARQGVIKANGAVLTVDDRGLFKK